MNLSFIKSMSTFSIAVTVSVLVHMVLIVAVNFTPPDIKRFSQSLATLDVVLVNAKSKTAPKKADLLAQANLDGGGNTDQKIHAKTALPPPKQSTTEVNLTATQLKSASQAEELRAAAEQKEQKVAELEKQAKQLLTQLKSTHTVDNNQTKQAAAPTPEVAEQSKTSHKSLDTSDLMQRSLEMARLEAQIAKQQVEYEQRPRRQAIGGRAIEYRYALYESSWSQKVEKIGTLNYPETAKSKNLHGSLQLTASINADGSLEKVVINRSSGSRILDDAAKRIIEMSAPFSEFTPEMRKYVDVLDITRTFNFTIENNVETSADK